LHDRRRTRHAFLQENVAGPHQRLGVKAPLHRTVLQTVRQRHQAHALVVRHVAAHHHAAALARQSAGRVVDRLITAVGPFAALGPDAAQILQRACGRTITAIMVA